MTNSKIKDEKHSCRKCKAETNHFVLYQESQLSMVEIFGKDDEGIVNNRAWMLAMDFCQILKCKGCETLSTSFEVRTGTPSEMKERKIDYLPSFLSRPIPKYVQDLQIELMELFCEVYQALNNNSPRLALMGARTIFDIVAVNKVGDSGNFKSKLNSLEKEGFISHKQSNIIETALDAGSAAAHRGFKPDEDLLSGVFDIIEHLVSLDMLERKAKDIKTKTPKREKI